MVAVAFNPVEISRGLSVIFNILTLLFFLLVVMYFAWRILFRRKSSNAKKSEEQSEEQLEELFLFREWIKNGIDMTEWLEANYQEFDLNPEATISNREFQDMLRKDFEIYNKLVILDPKLKEDQIFNQGRDFYKSFIRTENQKPS